MKRTYSYNKNGKMIEREVNYIPVRYIFAILLTVIELVMMIASVFLLCYFVDYFYVAAIATEVGVVITIIASEDNPDYKIPWLLFVLILPIVGFMLYFIFYSRRQSKRMLKRIEMVKAVSLGVDDSKAMSRLEEIDKVAAGQARLLSEISDVHLYSDTNVEYFSSGEDMMTSLLKDLSLAEKYILFEYFIVEDGIFWQSILKILKEKASSGVEVRVLFDDVGCMSTLPGNYASTLKSFGIKASPFARLKGSADGEFNNRNHRKITVIDGKVAYTGGVNIADEYINEVERFGHWKDVAVRLSGGAVCEMSKLFLLDYYSCVSESPTDIERFYEVEPQASDGFVVAFGDGPRPSYQRRVGQSLIISMLSGATDSVTITTPYLIVDNELCLALENAALRGVDVTLITPGIPDKKLVYEMTRSHYGRLIAAGVKIYEYTPGFIHAKVALADGKTAVVGTINLDYRSLVHHFENGVWMYGSSCIADISRDLTETVNRSKRITMESIKVGAFRKLIRAILKIFSPLM